MCVCVVLCVCVHPDLKANRLVDAIDVSNMVLRRYPEYSTIRTDVLEKAQMQLRP